MFALYWKPTVSGKVVEPFDVVGTETLLFSVLAHTRVWETALKSKMRTMTICPSTALAVVIVSVNVAAELFVTVVIRYVIGTVAALAVAVKALLVLMICKIVALVETVNA